MAHADRLPRELIERVLACLRIGDTVVEASVLAPTAARWRELETAQARRSRAQALARLALVSRDWAEIVSYELRAGDYVVVACPGTPYDNRLRDRLDVTGPGSLHARAVICDVFAPWPAVLVPSAITKLLLVDTVEALTGRDEDELEWNVPWAECTALRAVGLGCEASEMRLVRPYLGPVAGTLSRLTISAIYGTIGTDVSGPLPSALRTLAFNVHEEQPLIASIDADQDEPIIALLRASAATLESIRATGLTRAECGLLTRLVCASSPIFASLRTLHFPLGGRGGNQVARAIAAVGQWPPRLEHLLVESPYAPDGVDALEAALAIRPIPLRRLTLWTLTDPSPVSITASASVLIDYAPPACQQLGIDLRVVEV